MKKKFLKLIFLILSLILVVSFLSLIVIKFRATFFRSYQNHNYNTTENFLERYDLASLKILSKTVWYIQNMYIDPSRIDWYKMLLSGLDYIQKSIAEVIVYSGDGEKNKIRIHVGGKERSYLISDVNTSWRLLHKFREIITFIKDNIYEKDDKEYLRNIEYAAIKGILKPLDPHSMFLEPDIYKEMKLGTTGQFGGLGIVISIRDNQLTIVSPIEGTPAHKAGLKPKDRIVQIEDLSTVNMSLNEAVNLLRGEPGTKVTIWIMRDGWDSPKPFTLTRAIIKVKSVAYKMLDNRIGYIRIKDFQSTTFEELKEAISKLKKNGLSGLILDLRNNPGGLLEQAVTVSDLFLKEGVIVSTSGANPLNRQVFIAKDDGDELELPMVLIVNEGSASASEIVAGAVRNNKKAVLIGERTFGKGSVQMLFENKEDSSALKLTVAEYLTPGGISIQSEGVSPDIRLKPVVISNDFIDLIETDNILREKDLKDHLETSVKKKESYPPLDQIEYLAEEKIKSGNEDDNREEEELGYEEDKIVIDFPVKVAQSIVLEAIKKGKRIITRDNLLEVVSDTIEKLKKLSLKEIEDKFNSLGIDWKKYNSFSDLKDKEELLEMEYGFFDEKERKIESLQDHTLSPLKIKNYNLLTAGERIYLKVTLYNKGSTPLFRLHGITKSDNPYFDGKEFVWGKLLPGERKEWKVKLSIPHFLSSRIDPIFIKIMSDHKEIKEGPPIVVKINELPRPIFAYTYQVLDIKNRDGLISKNDEIALFFKVKNIGEGSTRKAHVILRNESGKMVFIQKGQIDLSNLKPGEEREGLFRFYVKDGGKDDNIRLSIAIIDLELRIVLSDTFNFKLYRSSLKPETGSGCFIPQNSKVELLEAPMDSSRLIGYLIKDNEYNIREVYADYYQIKLSSLSEGIDRVAWVKKVFGKKVPSCQKVSEGTFEELWYDTPPLISIDKGLPLVVTEDHIQIKGEVKDDQNVLDMYIIVGDMKKFYKANSKQMLNYNPKRMTFDALIPLELGTNYIYITARENTRVSSYNKYVVRRNKEDGSFYIKAENPELQF